MNKIKEYQSSVIENARQDARTKKNDPANLVINGKPLYTYSYSELTAMFDGLPLSTRESIIRYYDNWQMVLEIQNEPEYKDYVSSMQDYLETFNSLSPEEQKQLKSLISSEGNQFLTNLREKLIPYELNDIKRLGDLSGINPVAEVEEVNKNKIDYVYERLIPLMICFTTASGPFSACDFNSSFFNIFPFGETSPTLIAVPPKSTPTANRSSIISGFP